MDFDFISTPFFYFCLYLSKPLVLVTFYNLSIRKRVSCKSRGVKFNTFSTCFVDFVSSSFFIGFCDLFEAIWSSILHYFCEKTRLKSVSKKEASPLENESLWQCPGAPRDAASYYSLLKAAASRARCLDNNNNKVKLNSIQIELRSG